MAGPKVLVSCSGGKDCALAPWETQRTGCQLAALLTTAAAACRRVCRHAVRNILIDPTGIPPIHASLDRSQR
jgi:diphthamide synthase (EF-2-diphthine--ammonia ligase)